MRKSILLSSLLLGLPLLLSAQNLQLHYDFGRDIYTDEEAGRSKLTATFEQFRADRLGSWFYFIDLDLSRKGMTGAYLELSREFNIGRSARWAAHVEYNGGLSSSGGIFQPALLVGGAINLHTADFSTKGSVQLLYKQYFTGYNSAAYSSVQLTGVWSTTFCRDRITFSGYVDLWRGVTPVGHGCLIVMGEPQLWYNFSSHFSAGTEIEFSNKFIYNTDPSSTRTFFVNPTLGVRWTF